MPPTEQYAIAVIGVATAVAVAAGVFSKHSLLKVVFEKNARSYGNV